MLFGFEHTLLTNNLDAFALQTQSEIKEKAVKIYSNLSLLSINERKALFGGLTPELKSEIWKVHLRSYLSKHSDLTDEQRKAIESQIVFLTPQVYEIPQDSPEFEEKVNKPMQLLKKKMLEVFSREVVRELLNVLGGSESALSLNVERVNFVSELSNPGCAKTKQKTNSWLTKKEIQTQQPFKQTSISFVPIDCNCSTKSPSDCFVRQGCYSTGCSQKYLCGDYWFYVCNGECLIMGESD